MFFDCRDIPDRANAYLDRETTVLEFGKVAAHLSACPDCRTYVRSLKITRQLAASSLRTEMPAALKLRLGIGETNDEAPDEDRPR